MLQTVIVLGLSSLPIIIVPPYPSGLLEASTTDGLEKALLVTQVGKQHHEHHEEQYHDGANASGTAHVVPSLGSGVALKDF